MDRELLRQVQLAQLEIAKDIKRVCEEYGIRYFLDSGTLLGAVRHQGFIPWDDDMDIGMLREDFERFCEVAPKALGEQYFLQTWHTDSDFPMAYAKVRKLGTLFVEKVSQRCGIHSELFVDVFPYDVYPTDERQQRYEKRRSWLYRRILLMYAGYKPWATAKNSWDSLKKIIGYIPIRILAHTLNIQKLKDRFYGMMVSHNQTPSGYLYEQAGASDYGKWVIPASCFECMIEMSFEDTMFLCPGDSDLYLKSVYGDYMKLPPEDQRENRHGVVCVEL